MTFEVMSEIPKSNCIKCQSESKLHPPVYFKIISSYLKMSGMLFNREQVINALQVSHFYLSYASYQ
jgi:hypothetical protein